MDMNGVIERIKELCAIESPTGMAGAAADYVEAELEKLGDRLDGEADMAEIRRELDTLINRITGKSM